jgi:hypothetical protein
VESIFAEVRGGPELLHWFGRVPSFHDAEILDLRLRRHEPSILRLHGWNMTNRVDDAGYIVLEKHAVVTFALEGVMDLQLEGFSRQNVIDGLTLRRAPERPERRNQLTLAPSPDDIEIELDPCYGLSGLIRARSVEITFAPGRLGAQTVGV